MDTKTSPHHHLNSTSRFFRLLRASLSTLPAMILLYFVVIASAVSVAYFATGYVSTRVKTAKSPSSPNKTVAFRPSIVSAAQDPVLPPVSTDKTGYLAGETVNISGTGFGAGENVTVQVKHADNAAESGGSHEPFVVAALADGTFSATWNLNRNDAAGNDFIVSAVGSSSGHGGTANFSRIATVRTDKLDYKQGETVAIQGNGFGANETVTIQIKHLNGRPDGNGYSPFTATSNENGEVNASWLVDPTALDSILLLTATGGSSGLKAQTIFTDIVVTIIDDQGPDDEPGQKDLNLLSTDKGNLPTSLGVTWNWDDTAWSGNNTGDACSLFDTDGDGFANFSLCVTVGGIPAAYQSSRLYSCGDTASDRCVQPTTLISTFTSSCTATITANSDPFKNVASHNQSNKCNGAGCITDDTVAACTVNLADFGSNTANLINVCSYPSEQPNSAPSECVVTPNSGFLTIKKTTQTNDTGDATFTFNSSPSSQGGVSQFSKTITGQQSNVTVANLVSFAPTSSLSLTEVVPAGWDLTAASCEVQSATPHSTGTFDSATSKVSGIAIQSGLETICTFTDGAFNVTRGKIKVAKVTDPVGDTQSFDFDPNYETDFSLTGGLDHTSGFLTPGTGRSVSETLPEGWEQVSATCDHGTPGNIEVLAGQTTTCTFTNRKKPKLTVTKVVVNDNGGSKHVADFPLFIDGVSVTSGVKNTSTVGQHTVSETGDPGYTGTITGDCAADGTITLAAGDDKACTITNNDKAAKLTVIKHVINDNGGTKTAADFTLDSGGANDTPDNFAGAESPGTEVTLDAGAYNVTETGPSGYTASFSADCSGTIANGESKTCTVTNDDKPGKLTVIKHVINDNGGTKTAADFTLDSGGTNDSPDDFPGAESPGTEVTLDAGSYNVTETGPSGYTASYSADCSGTIANGESKTCTVTNNDKPGKLTIIKHVINDNGGTATAANFTLDSGGTNDSPSNFAGAESPGTEVTLDAGSYNVTETGPTGYTASYSADCSGTIANGESKTCTVTNDDKPGKLIVIKHVINDNGGTKTAADFTLDSGGTNDSPDDFPGAESPGTEVTLDAGSYNVTETGPSGYTASFSAYCSGTIANGQTKTCTVTNNDQPGKLTIIKHVINDNGGTATAANFTLDSGGTNDSPSNFAGAESPGTDVTLDAGSYNVTETGPTGYTASYSADCSGTIANGESKTCTVTNDDKAAKLIVIKHVINDNGGTATAANFTLDSGGTNDSPDDFAGAESPGTEITLDAGSYNVTESGPSGYTASFSAYCSGTISNGQTKTCTVTNNDQPAKLIIIKHVINNNGGTATAANFTLDSGGTNDTPDDFAGAESPGTQVTLDAGSYNVTETGPAGYSASFSAYCSGTIANGQMKTCTVTNDDISPTLRVIKDLQPDTGLFNLRIDAVVAGTGANVGDDGTTGFVPVNAGNHVVSETAGTNTSLSDYVATIGGDCASNGMVSLALGQNKTCTITNKKKGMAQVVKKVNGQTPPAGQSFTFELRQGASTVSDGTVLETKNTDASGNINFTPKLIPGDTYQICEWVFPAWNTNLTGDGPLFVPNSMLTPTLPNPNAINLVVCANFTVQPGQTRTFTVDNTPPPGGRALTIGFWKNWSSCTGGGQKYMLDLALGLASAATTNPPGGLVVSAQNPGTLWPNYAATWYLVLKGDKTSTVNSIKPAPDCMKAVNLLNKSTIDGKKKMASDPLFNMAAQLAGAQLNRFMGAGINGTVIMDIDRAVLLLGKYAFNGNTYSGKLTTADANTANCLATQLDNYNNGRPVSLCP